MKKNKQINKYLVFASIGFELIALILLALWLGDYLSKKGYGAGAQAFCILAAFIIWFVGLILKLKNLKKNENSSKNSSKKLND